MDERFYVELINEQEVMHETDKALLLKDTETGEEKWFPKSVMGQEYDFGYLGYVLVSEWFADNEGLDYRYDE